MLTLDQVRSHRDQVLNLAEKRRIMNVRIFGSVARGDATNASDLDFLVTPKPGCSLLDLGGLLMDLQDLFNCKVDIVTDEGIKPRARENILRDAVPI
jgi:predicted nucleotidyltransferase